MGFWGDLDCTLNSNPQPESERAARADVLSLHAQLNCNARLQNSLDTGSPATANQDAVSIQCQSHYSASCFSQRID